MICLMKRLDTGVKISIFLTALFLAGLIPVFLIARYNYPCADDFGFSAYSHIAWEESHSMFQVLKGACRTVAERWQGWQGTFSSIFVMALQPAIWGEEAYCLVPWIMIGVMSISSLFLLYVFFVRIVHAGRPVFFSVSMIYLIFALQCMVDKTQGFFWFNGAAHYMVPHSAALLLMGLLLLLLTEDQKRMLRLILSCLLAVFVGGSNYITALLTGILFVGAFCLLFLKDSLQIYLPENEPVHKGKKECALLALPFLFFLIAFALNVLAPGNAVRQETMEYRPGVIKSILLSFYYCAEYISETWFDWTYLLFVLSLLPFLWEGVKAVGCRFSYPCPLLVSTGSYCLLSAMFTPSLFATGIAGGGRIFNIIFLDFLLLVIANLFYYMGWLYRHGHLTDSMAGSCLERRNTKLYLSAVFLLTVFIGVLYSAVNPDYFTTSSACHSLLTGEAAAYGMEGENRTRAIRESEENAISIDCFSTHPYLLFFSDIGENPDEWMNRSMARYYQKQSISGVTPKGGK